MSDIDNSTEVGANRGVDEMKQDLDEDLSQIVHNYTSRGLPPSEIVDSLVWHGEVAVARSDEGRTIEEHITS